MSTRIPKPKNIASAAADLCAACEAGADLIGDTLLETAEPGDEVFAVLEQMDAAINKAYGEKTVGLVHQDDLKRAVKQSGGSVVKIEL